jgi:hypothetical protein
LNSRGFDDGTSIARPPITRPVPTTPGGGRRACDESVNSWIATARTAQASAA